MLKAEQALRSRHKTMEPRELQCLRESVLVDYNHDLMEWRSKKILLYGVTGVPLRATQRQKGCLHFQTPKIVGLQILKSVSEYGSHIYLLFVSNILPVTPLTQS